jgi:carboxyl-terminal processing protease
MTSVDPQPTSSDASPPSPPEPPVSPPVATPARPVVSVAAWIVALALAAVVGSLLFVGGYLVGGGDRAASTCAAPANAFTAFCEAYDDLKQQYVDNLDDAKLAAGAIQGMFEHGVADPFSGYMPPAQYQQALGDLSGKFSGIGAEMAVKNTKDPTDLAACTKLSDTCVLVVVSPIAGSPAEKAGLQAGDLVTAVDGKSVNGTAFQDEVTRVRGPKGTVVTLSIKRNERTFDLAITRDQITVKEVESRMIDGHVGYIALHNFSTSSPDEFHAALQSLLNQGATQIVFDLRDNPGGYILSAQKIASEFVSSGTIFTQESSGNEIKTWDALGGGLATNPSVPVVVLVNNGSASASEIVSAALKELHRATIIGEHSFGKNTVQLWSPLKDGSAVRITISRWFPPDHDSVHPNGVQPDVAVTIPDGTPPEKDVILDRALSYLASQHGGTAASPAPSVAPAAALPAPGALLPISQQLSWDNGGLFQSVG